MRIGVDLGGTKIEAIALDDDGEVRANKRIATPRGQYQATINAIAALVADLEQDLGTHCTVGVGTPGAISPATGQIKNANSTWLIGRALDRDLADALGRAVRLANDANCFALSEAVDGAAAGAHSVFGVILGTGVGGGLVVDRKPLVGRNAIAGEWGHCPLPWPNDAERPGPECYCGLKGCLETYLSGPGLVADHEAANGQRRAPQEIVTAAASGEAAADATIARYLDRLARGLAMVINLFDPEVIVLGGGLSNVGRLYEEVPPLLKRYVFSDRVETPIRPPRHGDASGVRGAAWLWPQGANARQEAS